MVSNPPLPVVDVSSSLHNLLSLPYPALVDRSLRAALAGFGSGV
jgi:hypothetical protein